MSKQQSAGAVFVVVSDENTSRLRATIKQASARVPEGRLLFVVWTQKDTWSPSAAVESMAVDEILGDPNNREESNWDFYGCGAARLYPKNGVRPSETVLWVGFRLKGPKAYLRNRDKSVAKAVINDSSIPVGNKVFTRDVANNVWHLSNKGGTDRVIGRLQSLTTWADERAIVFKGGRVSSRKHQTMDLGQDLVPVAQKVQYDLSGFPFATTGKGRASKQETEQLLLFE
jgi:hypothetical protein